VVVQIGLLEVVLLTMERCVVFALLHLQADRYLLSNCYAIILNVCPYVRNVCSLTSERLVTMCCRLCKRLVRDLGVQPVSVYTRTTSSEVISTVVGSSEEPSITHTPFGNIPVSGSDAAQSQFHLAHPEHTPASTHTDVSATTSVAPTDDDVKLEAFAEAVGVLFRVFGTCLRAHTRQANIQLLYALIHDVETVSTCMFHPVIVQYVLTSSHAITPMAKPGEATTMSKRSFSPAVQLANIHAQPSATGSTPASSAMTTSTTTSSQKMTLLVPVEDEDLERVLQSWDIVCVRPQLLLAMSLHYLRTLEGHSDGGVFVSATTVSSLE
jgi:hypothetical protein